ncbi:MAG TPA: NUDIX domain-containing protein [Thermomicrobiales bacterium]|nr:NUDIX domain-containing protein [Thermomicrobiales bacterium]
MPQVVSDIVDVYVFRRLNARVQFLLLQRRADVAMPHTWQAFHSQIGTQETTFDAIRRTVKELAGLNVSAVYSADYVNQFYDESRDVLVLAPVFAVNVSPQAPVSLGDDFRDCAWFDRDEATSRLPFSGQRWATRHIDEIMSLGEAESEIYRLELPEPPLTAAVAPAEPVAVVEEPADIAPADVAEADAEPVEPAEDDVRDEEPETTDEETTPNEPESAIRAAQER